MYIILALLVFVGVYVVAESRVALVRPPYIVSEKDQITLQVRIVPDTANRRLVLAAVDGDFVVRRSDEQLEGDRAARTRWIRWFLPPCDPCLIVAAVYGVNGKEIARATSPLIVRSVGP